MAKVECQATLEKAARPISQKGEAGGVQVERPVVQEKIRASRPPAMTMARKGRSWAERVAANVAVAAAVAAEVRRGKWPGE